MANQSVTIDSIEGNQIQVTFDDGNQETLTITGKALQFLDRVKIGKATLGFDNEGGVNFVQSAFKPKQGFNSYGKRPSPQKTFNQGFRQASQTNSFNSQEEKPYHYEVKRQILEKVKLDTIDKTQLALEANSIWVFATQIFPRLGEFEEDKNIKELQHALYDCIIYTKIKCEGKRENGEENY